MPSSQSASLYEVSKAMPSSWVWWSPVLWQCVPCLVTLTQGTITCGGPRNSRVFQSACSLPTLRTFHSWRYPWPLGPSCLSFPAQMTNFKRGKVLLSQVRPHGWDDSPVNIQSQFLVYVFSLPLWAALMCLQMSSHIHQDTSAQTKATEQHG